MLAGTGCVPQCCVIAGRGPLEVFFGGGGVGGLGGVTDLQMHTIVNKSILAKTFLMSLLSK